ncbi:MAG: hypothetical protein JO248_01120 [Acidimicrobiia bacterium]|nr:hypothetical protein [Acidimicrobiia bacterium]MBV8983029.1 hypothetical protein [Acidimicrobiia bacterium]MBV9285716.1 hypothetical protein [Acidimicrobiia bacterium]
MFYLPTLQPCDGVPVWLMADDELTTEALMIWWPAGTTWLVHGPTPNDHLDAA